MERSVVSKNLASNIPTQDWFATIHQSYNNPGSMFSKQIPALEALELHHNQRQRELQHECLASTLQMLQNKHNFVMYVYKC